MERDMGSRVHMAIIFIFLWGLGGRSHAYAGIDFRVEGVTSSSHQRVHHFFEQTLNLVPEEILKFYKNEVRVNIRFRTFKRNNDWSEYCENWPELSRNRRYIGHERRSIHLDNSLLEAILSGGEEITCAHGNTYKLAQGLFLRELFKIFDQTAPRNSKNQTIEIGLNHNYTRFCRETLSKNFADSHSARQCRNFLERRNFLSGNPYFRTLAGFHARSAVMGYDNNQNRFFQRAIDPREYKSEADSLAINLEYFVLDESYQCRRPTLQEYFRKTFEIRPLPSQDTCQMTNQVPVVNKEFVRSVPVTYLRIDLDRIYEIHFVFADRGPRMMSRWGHSLFRIVMCRPGREKGPDCLQDTASDLILNFRAMVPDFSIDYLKGLRGKYDSLLFIQPLREVVDEYTKTESELRDVVSLPVKMDEWQKKMFVLRALEIYWGYKGGYYFLSNNCATEAMALLAAGFPYNFLLQYRTDSTLTPLGQFRQHQKEEIFESSILNPFSEKDIDALVELIEYRRELTERGERTLSLRPSRLKAHLSEILEERPYKLPNLSESIVRYIGQSEEDYEAALSRRLDDFFAATAPVMQEFYALSPVKDRRSRENFLEQTNLFTASMNGYYFPSEDKRLENLTQYKDYNQLASIARKNLIRKEFIQKLSDIMPLFKPLIRDQFSMLMANHLDFTDQGRIHQITEEVFTSLQEELVKINESKASPLEVAPLKALIDIMTSFKDEIVITNKSRLILNEKFQETTLTLLSQKIINALRPNGINEWSWNERERSLLQRYLAENMREWRSEKMFKRHGILPGDHLLSAIQSYDFSSLGLEEEFSFNFHSIELPSPKEIFLANMKRLPLPEDVDKDEISENPSAHHHLDNPAASYDDHVWDVLAEIIFNNDKIELTSLTVTDDELNAFRDLFMELVLFHPIKNFIYSEQNSFLYNQLSIHRRFFYNILNIENNRFNSFAISMQKRAADRFLTEGDKVAEEAEKKLQEKFADAISYFMEEANEESLDIQNIISLCHERYENIKSLYASEIVEREKKVKELEEQRASRPLWQRLPSLGRSKKEEPSELSICYQLISAVEFKDAAFFLRELYGNTDPANNTEGGYGIPLCHEFKRIDGTNACPFSPDLTPEERREIEREAREKLTQVAEEIKEKEAVLFDIIKTSLPNEYENLMRIHEVRILLDQINAIFVGL